MHPSRRSPRRLRTAVGVPTALALAAGAWSLLQTALGVAWTAGSGGYPFVAAAGDAFPSLLADVRADVVAPAIALSGALTLLAVLASRHVLGSRLAVIPVIVLALASVAALLLVPEVRLLASVAYTPMLLIGAPFGWPEGASLSDAWTWPLAYQALCVAGGALWGGYALVAYRAARSACIRCGRGRAATRWTSTSSVSSWGRWAVAFAVVIPVLYAVTRFAWALGIPLGITTEVLREGQETGLWARGAVLGALAMAGAGLTLGLAQRWGEVAPRWLPLAGGRMVPPAAATVPAVVVAVLVASAGLEFVRLYAVGALDDFFAGASWAVIGPELLWPLWGVALAGAAVAYHLRRRGPCRSCGAGDSSRQLAIRQAP